MKHGHAPSLGGEIAPCIVMKCASGEGIQKAKTAIGHTESDVLVVLSRA